MSPNPPTEPNFFSPHTNYLQGSVWKGIYLMLYFFSGTGFNITEDIFIRRDEKTKNKLHVYFTFPDDTVLLRKKSRFRSRDYQSRDSTQFSFSVRAGDILRFFVNGLCIAIFTLCETTKNFIRASAEHDKDVVISKWAPNQ